MINSVYGEEQTCRIIVAGIKGWRSKVDRCYKEGKKLRRTAKDSQKQREKDELLGKSNWFMETRTKDLVKEDHTKLLRRPGKTHREEN